MNQLLSASNDATQALFANDILNTEFVPIPSSLLARGWTLDPGSMFDTELLQLASPEMTSGFNDLLGYFADEATNLGSLF